MCFSATASFAASAILGGTGIMALRQVRTKGEFPLASIPLFFAIQQFIEGLLWLSIGRTPIYVLPLTYAFLFFTFFWWPLYAPFMAFSIENRGWRKKLLFAFCCVGAVIGATLYAGFLQNPIPASIVNRCVYYPLSTPYATLLTYWYVFITVCSGLITSQPIVRLFSVLLGASALIAWKVYTINFTSIWCFFAATLSIILYFYFRSNRIALQTKKTI